MFGTDAFAGVNRHNISETPGVEQFPDLEIEGGIPQHKAGGEQAAALLVRGMDRPALFHGGRQRLFRENMLAGGKGGENVFLMRTVRGTDHNPFNPRSGDGFLVGTALQRARSIPEARFFRHHFPVGIIERGDLDPAVAFTQQMVHDHMRAGAAADDGDFHCFFRIHFICFP